MEYNLIDPEDSERKWIIELDNGGEVISLKERRGYGKTRKT